MAVCLLKGRLPSAYQEVEYIESTGTQYIDTEVTPDNSTGLKVVFSDLAVASRDFNFIGSRLQSSSRFMINYTDGNFGYGWDSYYTTNESINASVKNTAELNFYNNRNFIANGNTLANLSTISISNMPTIYIFGQHISNSNNLLYSYKVYECEITQDDLLIRKFIPCYRKSDNVIGLYETINDVFYTNQGTGVFTKGSDVFEVEKVKINAMRLPQAYQEVEYIESNGSPYIDTGIKLTSEDIVKCKFELTSTPTSYAEGVYGTMEKINSTNTFFVLLMRTPNLARVGTSSNQVTSTNVATNTIYDTTLKNGTYIENGTTYTFTPHNGFTFTTNCYLFARNQASMTPIKGKIYSFEIVGKFFGIPCYRKSDNAIGMYDTISNTFFENAGSGTFTKGNDMPFQKLSATILKKTDNLLNIYRQGWNADNKQPTDSVTFDYKKLYYMASSGYIRPNPHTLNEKLTLSSVNYTQNSSSWWGIGFPIEVKPSTKYTIGAKRLDGVNTKINYSLYNEDGTFDSYAQLTTNTSNLSPTLTITTGANIKTLVILVCGISTNADIYAYDLQVVEGQTLPTYKPYYELTKI